MVVSKIEGISFLSFFLSQDVTAISSAGCTRDYTGDYVDAGRVRYCCDIE